MYPPLHSPYAEERLQVKDVDCSAPDAACFEVLKKILLHDEGASGGVDEERCRLHIGQVLRVDYAARSIGEDKVHRYHVGIAEQLISAYCFERLFTLRIFDGKTSLPGLLISRLLGEVGAPRDYLHTQCDVQDLCHGAPQSPEAKDTQRLTGEFSSEAGLPRSLFNGGIITSDTAGKRKDEGDAVLSCAAGARCLLNSSSLFACAGNWDPSCFEGIQIQGSVAEGCSE
ncbi:hypothetical protein HG530_004132 [Fusarium avenaceum]|nr:hypothetical protein HG530_004132 [Fusarium avenaceum]